MLKAMTKEALASKEFDVGAELRVIEQDVLSVIPKATESTKLSFVEKDVSELVRIVLANRINDYPDESDFIISRLTVTPGKPIERETYRWSSAYSDSKLLQFYETVELNENEKLVRTSRKGFDKSDTEKLREWITQKGEIRHTDDQA